MTIAAMVLADLCFWLAVGGLIWTSQSSISDSDQLEAIAAGLLLNAAAACLWVSVSGPASLFGEWRPRLLAATLIVVIFVTAEFWSRVPANRRLSRTAARFAGIVLLGGSLTLGWAGFSHRNESVVARHAHEHSPGHSPAHSSRYSLDR